MSSVPPFVAVAGVASILVALADVFLTLFHPTVTGPIGSAIQRATWRAAHTLGRGRTAAVAVAAPIGVLLTIATWATLLVFGWAFVYWPHLPDGFHVQEGVDVGSTFLTALYTSGVTLSTLGYGEIAPATGWLRLVTPIESLLGFALLTASLSWLISIYPALHRRRQFARRLAAAIANGGDDRLRKLSPSAAAAFLQEAETGVAAISTDLEQLPVTYYFREDPAETALPRLLRTLVDVCDMLPETISHEDVAFRAEMLRRGLDDLADRLRHGFLPDAGRSAVMVLDAYVEDHGVTASAASTSGP
ncbi:MAG: two pore domain potassium channel family protein [Thermoleophilia bacterium]|nr:two pore domain potassium channel family protein [Thermoleophilia bacterium]